MSRPLPTDRRIAMAFAGRAVKADPPGTKRRAHLFQVPSDRMREKTAEFIRVMLGLVPDERFHDDMICTLHAMVERGEETLIGMIEGNPIHKGYTVDVGAAPQDPAHPEPEEDEDAEDADPYLAVDDD